MEFAAGKDGNLCIARKYVMDSVDYKMADYLLQAPPDERLLTELVVPISERE